MLIALLFALALVASWFASRAFYAWRERERRFSRLVRQFQADVAEEAKTREALREANLAMGQRQAVVYQFAPRKRRGEGSPAA